jgi:hypothetical protein
LGGGGRGGGEAEHPTNTESPRFRIAAAALRDADADADADTDAEQQSLWVEEERCRRPAAGGNGVPTALTETNAIARRCRRCNGEELVVYLCPCRGRRKRK